MTTSKRGIQNSSGFSIIEVMISLAVASSSIYVCTQMIVHSHNAYQTEQRRVCAMLLGESVAEELLQRFGTDPALSAGYHFLYFDREGNQLGTIQVGLPSSLQAAPPQPPPSFKNRGKGKTVNARPEPGMQFWLRALGLAVQPAHAQTPANAMYTVVYQVTASDPEPGLMSLVFTVQWSEGKFDKQLQFVTYRSSK